MHVPQSLPELAIPIGAEFRAQDDNTHAETETCSIPDVPPYVSAAIISAPFFAMA